MRNSSPRTRPMTLEATGTLERHSLLVLGLISRDRRIVGHDGLAKAGAAAEQAGRIGVAAERSRSRRRGRSSVVATDATLPVVTDGPLQPRPLVVEQQSTDTEAGLLLLLLQLLLHRSSGAG